MKIEQFNQASELADSLKTLIGVKESAELMAEGERLTETSASKIVFYRQDEYACIFERAKINDGDETHSIINNIVFEELQDAMSAIVKRLNREIKKIEKEFEKI